LLAQHTDHTDVSRSSGATATQGKSDARSGRGFIHGCGTAVSESGQWQDGKQKRSEHAPH
jgi:hypothetical protein